MAEVWYVRVAGWVGRPGVIQVRRLLRAPALEPPVRGGDRRVSLGLYRSDPDNDSWKLVAATALKADDNRIARYRVLLRAKTLTTEAS